MATPEGSPYIPNFGVVTLSSATVTLTNAGHAGQMLVLDRAAGVTATLPAATGSGARFNFRVKTSVTSNAYIIQVANASDVMTGTAELFQDAADTIVGFATASTSDTITMNGTTTGGLLGAHVDVVDIATNLWHVRLVSDASGTEATPFSAAV